MPHTVLLVDDEPNVMSGLQRALRKEPYEILSASSTREAFNILQTQPVDVVISDQDMPDMTGTEFLAKVQRAFPDTARFILTGKSALATVQQALDTGIIRKYLSKPCNRADLSDTIQQALAQRSPQAEAPPLSQTFAHQITALERLSHRHPDLLKELLATIRQVLPKKDAQANTPPGPETVTQYVAELERLTHDYPETLTALLEMLHQLLLRKGLQTEAQSLGPLLGQGSIEPACATTAQTEPAPEDGETADAAPDDASFATCLQQLRLAAQKDQGYPGIMRLRRDETGLSMSTLGEISFEDCRLLCAKAREVFLVRLQNGKVFRAKLDSIQATSLIVDTERSTFSSKPGEKFLVLFPVPPCEHYVWLTWIDSTYFRRLKLGYHIPQYRVHR